MSDIVNRKAGHIDIVSSGPGRPPATAGGFDAVRLERAVPPEIDRDEVDMSSTFPGRPVSARRATSATTGGAAEVERIDRQIAEVRGSPRLGLSVRPQRVAPDRLNARSLSRRHRVAAGALPTIANFRAATRTADDGPDHAMRATCMIGADALVPHPDPLQGARQPRGSTRVAAHPRRIETPARDLTALRQARLSPPDPGCNP